MAQIDHSTDNTEPSPFMTDYAYDDDATHFSVSDPVWRILTGAAAFAIGVFICGSVGSYVATDPSWNAATDSDVQNLFGRSGAVFADLARQTLGWSAWTAGLALMIGLIAVIPTSDTFSSVLLGIPGSSASQATVLDGFPLAKQGHAARALSAAFASSLFGGLCGAIVLTFFILIARPLILAFGLPEMLMITILGLSMVAILAGRVPLKGVVAAGLGLMFGTIGAAPAGGSLRMSTYDLPYLVDGFQLVIVGLGIYAVPEIVSLLRQDRAIAEGGTLGDGWTQGVRDWWTHRWLSLRCAVIGVIVGVIPGLGGSVVDWLAYGSAVQTAKDKSQFGQGDIRGVIAPESSNNAKEGGGLVPTLIFGIPGSGSMAIFL
ncbi:DNA translocase FtsK 4TM domain-containing protein, partial [Hyphomonas sp.]|uniref:DNA translocase FtsK 4TM domain-containing protein n=1 Tax=Hyphomonas sp. TaxID=87 RepID=UPI003242445C